MNHTATARQAAPALRVYLVEDSAIVRERLETMVTAIAGARTVGSASRADDAIRGILAERPDVVVLDMKLEQGSGFDVLRAVHDADPSIDVYMLSNFAAEPYRRLAEKLGAREFFDKSNEIERVREVLLARSEPAN